ncbi:MAG: septum formation initiator family protein [Patescibacteria group bacterium]|nr:septum formation initiator family protein [Patescibacteria group bacterium]
MKQKSKWGGWVLVGVLLVMMVRLGGNVWRLWKAGERIKQAEAEVDKETKENKQLKARLAQVQSPEFIEKEAREKLGLGKPGEEIVNLPKQEQESVRAGEREEANWRKWWKLYISD